MRLPLNSTIDSTTRHPSAVANTDRIVAIDNARAIGIVLVVLGHSPGLPHFVNVSIFAFHVPLFFFLSGALTGPDRLAASFITRIRQLHRTLLVPYVFFFAVAFVYWLAFKRHGLHATEMEALPWWDPIAGFVLGTGNGLYVDAPLWFFPCLLVTALVHHILRKRLGASTVALLTLAVAQIFVLSGFGADRRWPWSTDCAIVAIAFFSLGSALGGRLRHYRPTRTFALMTAAVCATCCASLAYSTDMVDLNQLNFGREPSLYVPMSLVGIAAALAMAAALPKTRLAKWLSVNTIVIFPLHSLIFSLTTGVAVVVLHLDPAFRQSSAWIGILYTALAVACCWPVAHVLRQIAPWALGIARARLGRVDLADSSSKTLA